jgi:hypothetical protein
VRGQRSGRGGWRSGQRRAPWWRGAHYRVSGVAEQPEKAATGEVLTEEDDGGESRGPASLAGATGRFLVQEVCGDEALPLVWSDSSEMAHR